MQRLNTHTTPTAAFSGNPASPLERNGLLSGLPAADLTLLGTHLVKATFPAGTVLQDSGQAIGRVYFPFDGLVSLLRVLPDGVAVDVATIGREGGIGLSAGIGSHMALARAIVQSPMRAACTSAVRFASLAAHSPALREMIVHCNDMLLAQLHQTAACNTVHHLQARLCRWLLHARDRLDVDTIDVTQQFLSNILGAQRTSITMISRGLQAEGVIDVRRGHLRIRNVAALEAKACSCYAVLRSLLDDAALEYGTRHFAHADGGELQSTLSK